MRKPRLPFVGVSLLLAACGGSTSSEPVGREISVSAADSLRFSPASIEATPGERIRFTVTNTGSADHEFAIGDADFHREMDSTDDHEGHAGSMDGGAAVSVAKGETKTLDFTMPDGTAPTYACHVDDHDAAGMVGRVVYS